HTDELTLDECDQAEKISGTPYSLLNPGFRAKDAKALYLVALLRSGASEEHAVKQLLTITLADAAKAFRWEEASLAAAGDGEQLPPS
ncbi:MAG: hypothetical protein JWP57_4558, partial [Spirosoma sp.]|nr:hypothetical protein [Spirosoma sp.]